MAKKDLVISTIEAWKNYDFDSNTAEEVASLCIEQVFAIVMDGASKRDVVIGTMIQNAVKSLNISKIEERKGINRALEVLEQIRKIVSDNVTEEIETLIHSLQNK